jgi:hypothetical protein
MVTATPHEDVEAAYGQGREEQLVLDIMCDAALCCRERHPYMPTNEEERRNFVPHLWVLEGASEYANHAYAEGRKDEAERALANWQPIETAPEDEHILIATTGGHVGTAYWTDEGDGKVWGWGHPEKDGGQYVHQNLTPLVWMPLPKHPEAA